MSTETLKVIPLGGLGEIGKNMMALEYGGHILVIDCGLMFPQEEMLGVDLVIPDITYLRDNRERVLGILITHGHEDHTGALPYVLPELKVPVYAPPLARGLISLKLKEHNLLRSATLESVRPGDELALGPFQVGFFQVSHSIPDATGLVIDTPLGTVVHSGDFKLDHTPVDGKTTDLGLLAQLGRRGVLLLLSDSTYAEVPGYTPSEKTVGETMDRIMAEAEGRVIVATFASHISRVQQVMDAAGKHGRRVYVVGRSMIENVNMALELGYLEAPPGLIAKVDELRSSPLNRIAVITTGTQGEPTSVLVRMAHGDHRLLKVIPGDTVVVSASPIPGNEQVVNRTINNLFKEGAQVLYGRVANVHVHGHGSQEELKMLLSLVKPRYMVPVHGEYRHLMLHAQLAKTLGISPDHTFVLENGDVLEIGEGEAAVTGRVNSDYVYVDGLGDVGNIVLRDRKHLSRDGILVAIIVVDKRTGHIVGRPDLVSRGFADIDEAQGLLDEARDLIAKGLDQGGKHYAEWSFVNTKVKNDLGQFLYERTKRRPMILPIVMEV
ncbi:MAG: ribonuclease J [Chloroflexi bacterium]|nr:ribonuclease J [Chloroflexota bacterium]